MFVHYNGPILHCFRDTASYCPKLPIFVSHLYRCTVSVIKQLNLILERETISADYVPKFPTMGFRTTQYTLRLAWDRLGCIATVTVTLGISTACWRKGEAGTGLKSVFITVIKDAVTSQIKGISQPDLRTQSPIGT